MSTQAREQGGLPGANGIAPTGQLARPGSIEERRRLVAQSLQVGNPGNRARDLPEQADPRHDCQIELKVDEIRPYEHNPRRANNAKFSEIKESIRATGIRNPLTVTRRPGEKHFIVEAGGNTRLLAIQQLWAETRDTRFEKLTVLFRPWRSESHVLTSHLVENDLRGEMTFWDKASGVHALKARLEAQAGRAFLLKPLEEAMKGLGLSVNIATLSHYQFAMERLRTLGEVVTHFSLADVKILQPRLNLMKRYAHARVELAEDQLYAAVFEPIFRDAVDRYRQSQAFSAADLCSECEEALARHLGEPVAQLRSALPLRRHSPPLAADASRASPLENSPLQLPVTAPAKPATSLAPEAADRTVDVSASPTAADTHPVRGATHYSPSADNPAVPFDVVESVGRLAALVGIESLLRLNPTLPLGYYVAPLPGPAEAGPIPPLTQQAWWLLAALSGQLDGTASAACVPGSPGEDPATEVAHRQAAGKLTDTVVLDPAFVRLLVDPNNETGSAVWGVLTVVRAARSSDTAHRGISVALRGKP